MKRICLIVSLMVVLFGSVLVLDTYHATFTVQAQADPNASPIPHTIYLPLIANELAISQTKIKSGIHMGNRNTDWRPEFFQLISGTVPNVWPASVVIQSNQVYDLIRPISSTPANPLCRINNVTVRSQNLYAYLTEAVTKHKTKVVIRITPSPGNFLDYDATPAKHSLQKHKTRTDEVPVGGNYCGTDPQGKLEAYRDIGDVVSEMNAIYQVNTDMEHQWPKDSFYFEPANEPNYEWYDGFNIRLHITTTLVPNIDNSEAWANMDDYFGALITLSHATNAELLVLTPAMAQAKRAERLFPGKCDHMTVVGGENQASGYDFMPKTYLSDQFAGYSWHNYWDIGSEDWEHVLDSMEHSCDNAPIVKVPFQPHSQHVSQYFSYEMRNYLLLSDKPAFITEADLNSPCQNQNTPLKAKTATLSSAYPVRTAPQSLRSFIAQEKPGQYAEQIVYVNAWLLVNQFAGGNNCKLADNQDQDDVNYEINWHEGYGEDGIARGWFATWWLGGE